MMREKTQNIMKMNGLYLEDFLHKNQSYCQVLPEEKKEDNSLPQIEQKQKLYIHNFDYVKRRQHDEGSPGWVFKPLKSSISASC